MLLWPGKITVSTMIILLAAIGELECDVGHNSTDIEELITDKMSISVESTIEPNNQHQTMKYKRGETIFEIPYLVKVISVYVCSGVIIHRFWVLTAAQCFGSSKSAQVHWHDKVVESVKVFIHPDYISVLEPGTVILGNNDLALVQLQEPIHFTSTVNKIDLDGQEWPQDRKSYNRSCMAAGTSRHRITNADEDYVHGRIFNAEHGDNACACLPQSMKKKLVCMKESDKTFCAEDLGGPLVCDNKLVAILHTLYDLNNCKDQETRVAPACDSPNAMGVCTFICPYLNWIKYYVPSVPSMPPSCRSTFLTFSFTLVNICVLISFFFSFTDRLYL